MSAESIKTDIVSIEQRRAALQGEIARYVKHGYRVVSEGETSAQLVKPKRVSCLWVTIMLVLSLLLVGLLLLLIYFLWYATQKDEQVYLTVDEQGKVQETRRRG